MTDAIAARSVDFLFEQAPPTPDPVSITFFGGEPLLEPALIEFVHDRATARAQAEGRQISFGMTTNATLLSRRNAELIKRLGIATRLSLDGIGDAHDRHRVTRGGRGSFALISRNLERAAALDGVSVRLTVTPETAADLPASISWLAERGFTSIGFSPVIEAEWTEESLAQLFDALRHLYALAPRVPSGSLSNLHKTDRALGATGPRWGCGAARGFVAIDTEGFLYPCHRFVGYFRNGEDQRIGHVDRGFDVAAREYYIAANHSSTHQGCGHGLFSDEVASEQRTCGSCSLLSICGSNCMDVNEHMTGDPTKPPSINRALAQIEAAAHLAAPSAPGTVGAPDPCQVGL
jgi:uncharacterized protein